jgi:hypothetical protein
MLDAEGPTNNPPPHIHTHTHTHMHAHMELSLFQIFFSADISGPYYAVLQKLQVVHSLHMCDALLPL